MDVRELAGPDVEITAPIIEFSRPIEIDIEVVYDEFDIEVVNDELGAPTQEFTPPSEPSLPEGMDVRILAGPDVDITELLHMVLHACLGGWMWGNSKARR